MRNWLVFIFCGATVSLPLFAAPAPAAAPAPEVVVLPEDQPVLFGKTDGQPYYIDFRDGRIATSMQSEFAKSTQIPFQIIDNTCADSADLETAGCKLELSFWVRSYSIVWRENSDSDKIGKAIELNARTRPNHGYGRNDDHEIRTTFVANNNDRKRTTPDVVKIPHPRLICNDYGWLPGGKGATPPKKFFFLSWMHESLAKNPEDESRKNEEITLSNGVGSIELSQQNNTLEFTKIGRFITADRFEGVEDYFADKQEKISVVAKTNEGKICQITLEHKPFNYVEISAEDIYRNAKPYPYHARPGEVWDDAERFFLKQDTEFNGWGKYRPGPYIQQGFE